MNKTRKMTTMALLCTLAYVAMLTKNLFPPFFSAFPFLQYDPKDVIIVIGGFIYGPLSAFVISLVVSVIEMVTVSGTHIVGCIMNVASTCAYACVAAALYSKYRSIKGGIFGLLAGTVCAVATMLILNYWLTPLYQGMPREAIAALLVPAILPFNLIKCVLNSAIVLIIYKPITRILRRGGLMESKQNYSSRHSNIAVLLVAVFMLVACAIALKVING